MRKNIIIRFQIEGLHKWANCSIESEKYLSCKHRHIFYIECKKRVIHNNREIEVISFKRQVQQYLQKKFSSKYPLLCDFKGLSCEMLAEFLIDKFKLDYCSVLEDNENGAEIINS